MSSVNQRSNVRMPGILFRKIKRNIQDYGLAVFVRKSMASFLKPVFEIRAYHIYLVDLGEVDTKGPPGSREFTFRFLAPGETRLIAQIENMEEWLCGKLADKLRRGQKCLAAISGEEVAGFNLISFDVFQLPPVRLAKPLRASECSSEQITVHPKYRGKGLGTDLRRAFFSSMKDAGYRRIYGGTQATNAANRALTQKVGFRVFAQARYIHVFGHRRLRISRLKK